MVVRTVVSRFVGWVLACSAGWIVLVRADPSYPILAAAIISIVAAVGSLLGQTTPRLRLLGFLRFAPFFLRESIVGAWDVATRAVRGRTALSPGLIRYPMRFDPGSAPATFLMGIISLIPGTLCCDIDVRSIVVHVVDVGQDNHLRLRRIEERVAELFGVSLLPRRSD